MFYFNPQYLLFMAPALLAMLAAQWYVNSTYKKWGRIPNKSGISGAEVARYTHPLYQGKSCQAADK